MLHTKIFRILKSIILTGTKIAALIVLTCQSVYSQDYPDSNIVKAMQDELARNISELRDPSLANPFFIAYTIADAKQTQIVATLGALLRSDSREYKDWNARLLVGNYEINDENFTSSSPSEQVFQPNIDMPVENDYLGIRRSLWITTNNLYYSAAKTYNDKITQMELKNLTSEKIDIPDFSKAQVIRKFIPAYPDSASKKDLEDRIRSLSAVFSDYPGINMSSVSLNEFRSYVYMANTEGTEIAFPFNITTLSVQAETYSDDSERLNKNITYTVRNASELPDDLSIRKDIKLLADNLLTLRNTERFEDTYYGPVMLIGEIAAETFEKLFFAGSNALISKRENLHSTNQMNMSYEENSNDLQSRIGKPVISRDLTITSEPSLESYNGIPLLGNYEVDVEGVVPPGKLVLVENGVLKTLLNGRTPSRQVPESNGHMRFNYSSRGMNNKVGPGVIRVQNSNPVSVDKMKKQLIENAREEGLTYGVIIKSLETGGSDKPFNFYRINVETGEETLIRSVKLKNLTMQAFHRKAVFSDTLIVHNTLLSPGGTSVNGLSGIPSSFIVPYGILLQDVQLEGTRKALNSVLPVLPNPVSAKEPANVNH